MVELMLKVPEPRHITSVLMGIVRFNVPPLLGLDLLDAEQLYAPNLTNRLFHLEVYPSINGVVPYEVKWYAQITRVNDHLYTQMTFPTQPFDTTAQLKRFHLQFSHPTETKLYNLLKRAGLEAVTPESLAELEQIVANCEPCQRICNTPLVFRVFRTLFRTSQLSFMFRIPLFPFFLNYTLVFSHYLP